MAGSEEAPPQPRPGIPGWIHGAKAVGVSVLLGLASMGFLFAALLGGAFWGTRGHGLPWLPGLFLLLSIFSLAGCYLVQTRANFRASAKGTGPCGVLAPDRGLVERLAFGLPGVRISVESGVLTLVSSRQVPFLGMAGYVLICFAPDAGESGEPLRLACMTLGLILMLVNILLPLFKTRIDLPRASLLGVHASRTRLLIVAQRDGHPAAFTLEFDRFGLPKVLALVETLVPVVELAEPPKPAPSTRPRPERSPPRPAPPPPPPSTAIDERKAAEIDETLQRLRRM